MQVSSSSSSYGHRIVSCNRASNTEEVLPLDVVGEPQFRLVFDTTLLDDCSFYRDITEIGLELLFMLKYFCGKLQEKVFKFNSWFNVHIKMTIMLIQKNTV